MLGQHWDEHEHDHDQFQTTFLPINPKNYEHDSFSGELRYSSSECSSYVGSPNSINGTTYGAQSPTISYARELFNISDHFQGVQHNDVQCPNSIIESMNRATPYSPDEKKERIERYRSKRNLRNFTKKIKVCYMSCVHNNIILTQGASGTDKKFCTFGYFLLTKQKNH
ncbi:hypothetical protein ACS0TY_014720 [Phlomoides rotata]